MVRRKKIKLRYKKERVLFADVLPYEIPFIFTNRYFYRYLVQNEIRIEDDGLHWSNQISKGAFLLLKAIFAGNMDQTIKIEDGFLRILPKNRPSTIPSSYKIQHKPNKARVLSIIHPANQIYVVHFYEKYKSLILYYCNQSNFSLRHPNKVACYFYYKDKLHKELLGKKNDKLELFFNEYENLKSFFSYRKYSNIHKFYEDYRYQRAEKKFTHLLKFDLQSCFDSIYTHTIAWASNGGKNNYKNYYPYKKCDEAFGSQFDSLMQKMNFNETNGIVIGPEFSRIFAEIILGHIDKVVESRAKNKGYYYKMDYECFRYVDDYFLFYNDELVRDEVMLLFTNLLREYKLSISDSKTKEIERPFISEITRAKIQIDALIDERLSKKAYIHEQMFPMIVEDKNDEEKDEVESEVMEINEKRINECLTHKHYITLHANDCNARFKMIIQDYNLQYKDILNYTLARIGTATERFLKVFDKDFKILSFAIKENKLSRDIIQACQTMKSRQEQMLTCYLVELLDVVFFLYSNNKRVNTTLKVINILNLIMLYTKENYKSKENYYQRFSANARAVVLKKMQDEISLVLQATSFNEDTQMETLYFLIVLKELGTNYQLDHTILDKYLGIKYNKDGTIENYPSLNLFSFIVLLYYYGNRHCYKKSKQVLISKIFERFELIPVDKRWKHTDLIILLIDMLTCPFIDLASKKVLMKKMNIDDNKEQNAIFAYLKRKKYMFTKWTGIDINKELSAKISQEVYS
ncbi:antiviral reverse transcriptase Drt3b [Gabonibacter chumensis]|uniref:antiviral reverse transcriptase Drt3b n=1 Tax=Gabonibacter chumensis TaxID=2972474 RepID=UPI0025739232|nr:antiviral reverse transcriptase Drt3b [Gabonibacter chumensis]MCR9010838.1 RNA-directed DNA polymerase [Gabonibacter chumensis]